MSEAVWESLQEEGFVVRPDGRALLLDEAGISADAEPDEDSLQALQSAFLDVRFGRPV